MIWYNNPCSWLKRLLWVIFFITTFNECVFVEHLINIGCSEWLNLCESTCLRVLFVCYDDIFLILLKECFQIKFTAGLISSYTSSSSGCCWGTSCWKILRLRLSRAMGISAWWSYWSARPSHSHVTRGTSICRFYSILSWRILWLIALLLCGNWSGWFLY